MADILTTIAYLIYLEIIELKFCGLNKDIRAKIIDRGNSDFIKDMKKLEDDEDESFTRFTEMTNTYSSLNIN